MSSNPMAVQTEREDDGRWLADIPVLSGCLAYSDDRAEAIRACKVLALRILANRLENAEEIPPIVSEMFSVRS